MSEFDVLSPAQQQQIIGQYGSLAAARAAMEAPAPPPAGAPVALAATAPAAAPPAPKVDDINAGPITPEEAARYGATPRQVALSAAGPSNPDESWEQKQARLKSYGPAPDAVPDAPFGPPKATAAPADGNKYAKAPGEAAGAATTPGINWGGTGGGGVIPAHEQPVVSAKRQDALNSAIDAQGKAVDEEGRSLDQQKVAAGAAADANADLETARGVGALDIAKANMDAGVGVKERAAKAAESAKVYREHIDEFSRKLAEDKINPNRMWDDASVGQKIVWTLAKGLGAIAQGFLHQPTNQIVDQLEKMSAQDVAAQRANHEIGRERVADMNTLYGQALHATGNAEEAERVATGYGLKAAEAQAEALTANAKGAAQKAKGKEVIAELGTRIAALGERKAAVDEKKVEKGIAMNPLVQARAGAGGVDMNKVYASARDYVKEQAALGTKVSPDEAIRWAYKMHTGNDPLRNAGAFVGGVKGDPANKELRETQTATDEFNRQIDDLRKHPVITDSGLGTAIGAQLPQRVAPDSNDAQQQLNAINTRNLQAIGKVAKDADGKPNKEMIKKIEERFEIHLSDTPEMKQQKLQGVREVYNALARQQGANAPEPSKGPPPGMVP